MPATACTRVLALLGDPVEHSRSPAMHNAAMAREGLDGVYVALRCGPDELAGLLRGLAAAGGGGNVTVPHKERAAELVDVPSEAVRRTGACNTFWRGRDDRLHGDNTDVLGFGRAVETLLEAPPRDARVLLLGAGGAARAALVSLLDGGARHVVVLNRTPERARALVDALGVGRATAVAGAEDVRGRPFELVVQATSSGLDARDARPFPLETLGRVGAALDLVYGREPTPFVRAARALGIAASDGTEMLVQQGGASFERWWDRSAPLDTMRAAMQGAAP